MREASGVASLSLADYGMPVLARVKCAAYLPAMLGYLKRGFASVGNANVVAMWRVGFGSPHDLVQQRDTVSDSDCLFRDRATLFETTNGDAASTMRLNVTFIDIDCNTQVCMLEESTPVLTMGGRYNLGYAFVWLAWNTLGCSFFSG